MLGSYAFALGSLGFGEIVLILLIVILIFGTSRIPELGKGLGEGIKNFKKSVKGEEEGEKKS
jgi:sec-independent protein translocase protein TatA